jgi:hypothetical protein
MFRFFNRPIPESALAYCRSLALQVQRAFGHALTPEIWTSIMGTQVPDPTRVPYGLLAEKYLAPHVAAQARLAALLEYPPSKWLLEREMEARGNWPGPNLPNTRVPDVYETALGAKLVGVCLSGGGIRSATFNLGVLQAIAAEGKLGKIDYLSSVSGGGYIHLFLASWIHRKRLAHVENQLHPLPTDSPRTAWPEPIRWLRRYSNYLTPSKGLFTADTWAAVSIWLRNTFLNQIVLVSTLLTLLLLPHLPLLDVFGFDAAKLPSNWPADDLSPAAPALFALLTFLVAAIAVGCGLFKTPHPFDAANSTPTVTDKLGVPMKRGGFGAKLAFLTILVPVFVAIFMVAPFLYRSVFLPLYPLGHSSAMAPSTVPEFVVHLHNLAPSQGPAACTARPGTPLQCFTANASIWFHNYEAPDFWTPLSQGKNSAFTAFVIGHGLLVLAFVGAVPLRRGQHLSNGFKVLTLVAAALVAVVSSLLLLHLARIVLILAAIGLEYPDFLKFSIVFVPILLLGIIFISIDLAIGVVGRSMLDSSREWLARVRSFSFISGFAWLGLTGCSLLGPSLISFLIHLKWEATAGALTTWAATTAASILAGKSPSTGSSEDKAPAPNRVLSLLIHIGPPTFMAGLLLLLAFVLQTSLTSQHVESLGQYFATLIVLAIFALFFSWRVDINEFSLHSFYRDRIARCYAGASNPDRHPDTLTGLAESDEELRLAQLLPARFAKGDPSLWADRKNPPSYEGPFPIFSATLNLTFGEDLATQERKAACFAFTPLFCGYDVGWTEGQKPGVQFNGYVPTRTFAYPKSGGPAVTTAVSASGAALNPNDGFQTNTAMAFVLSFFNARLGWWLPNPRNTGGILSLLSGPTPIIGLQYLLEELFGMVSDDAPFVNVSDGGQFENMGLYELVRRRCLNILICDAEEDSDFTFEGLGMAIRKCRIDFGVEIKIPALSSILPVPVGPEKFSPLAYAEGTILYPNPTHPHNPIEGKILYLKSALTGAEPVDLRNYKRENPAFPANSTLDQWFTESQFESYRRLGQFIGEQAAVSAWLKAL